MSKTSSSLIAADPFLTPATLAMALWPSGPDMWIPQKHLVYASARVAHAIIRGNGRLIISMPPRHGKSRLINETTVPWVLEKFPGKNIMFTTYNGEFAEEWGGKNKDIITSRRDLFSFDLREDRSRVDRFETTKGSTCWFTGINGGQTGKGAHLVIIDDYIKDIEQAMSKTERDKIWNKFVANIWTRLEPNATIIIVATRWWSDDLIGRILKHLKGWEYICFPGIYKPDKIIGRERVADLQARDELGRKYGDVLFPERYTIERLNELQAAMKVSSTIFEALIQQTPVDSQTEFTDGSWLQIAHGIRTDELRCARAWDFAATQGGGDYTTGVKMGRKGLLRQAYILNVIRRQLSPLEIEVLIRNTAVADGRECTVLLEQEPGSQSVALVEHYKRNVLPEFNVIGVPAGNKSKVTKALPFIAAVQSGNVYMVDNSGGTNIPLWIEEFRSEFDEFPPPPGGRDDQVDMGAVAFNYLYQQDSTSPVWAQDSVFMPRVAMGIGSYSKIDPSLDAVFATAADTSPLVDGLTW